MLNVGQIDYANVYPIFHHLQKLSGFNLVKGVPSYLNTAIREGVIDLSPCSCIEYARNPENYYIIPNISISSIHEVQSVLLFSDVPIEELGGEEVFLTSESGTSIVLFEILMRERYGITPSFTKENPNAKAKVYIGDTALFGYYNDKSKYIYDLGTLWNEFTGLPFVFALWIIRKEKADKDREEVLEFTKTLDMIKKDSKTNLAALIDHYQMKGLTTKQIIDYWEIINYDLTEAHIQGLLKYFSYAARIGRIKKVPSLDFFI
ncbi:MAG: menaquinone biosynthetic enzyme MqnA/MqnD family protein [Deferribacterales bacterium]